MDHNSASTPLAPTWVGYLGNTWDACILFEACLQGRLFHAPRRPHDRERPDLIKSGSIFVYEEHSSGIKRWTDGVTWSPSRIMFNYLIYRELNQPFASGEKKRALRTQNKRNGGQASGTRDSPSQTAGESPSDDPFDERPIVGSLVSCYLFKDDGLMKKTISVTISNTTHHIVSYYSLEDVKKQKLQRPSEVDEFWNINPRAEFMRQGAFRGPIEESEKGGHMVTINRIAWSSVHGLDQGQQHPFSNQATDHAAVRQQQQQQQHLYNLRAVNYANSAHHIQNPQQVYDQLQPYDHHQQLLVQQEPYENQQQLVQRQPSDQQQAYHIALQRQESFEEQPGQLYYHQYEGQQALPAQVSSHHSVHQNMFPQHALQQQHYVPGQVAFSAPMAPSVQRLEYNPTADLRSFHAGQRSAGHHRPLISQQDLSNPTESYGDHHFASFGEEEEEG